MHLKHSFRGVQVYGCEKLYAVEICFNTDVRKWQMRSVLEVLCGYSVLGHLHVSVAWGVVVSWKLQIHLIFFITVQLSLSFTWEQFQCTKRYIEQTTGKYLNIFILRVLSIVCSVTDILNMFASCCRNSGVIWYQKQIKSVPPRKEQLTNFKKIKTLTLVVCLKTNTPQSEWRSVSVTQTHTYLAKRWSTELKFALQIGSMQMNPGRYCENAAGWLNTPEALMTHSWKTEREIPKKGHCFPVRSKECHGNQSHYLQL